MGEPLPLATVHDAVLEFLRGRDDAVLFGAHAVNAYVDEPRMTQDVDLLSFRAEELAAELAENLKQRFQIAVRTRMARGGLAYRIYQIRKPGNRHLVDIRSVMELPPHQRLGDVLVLMPADLICYKVLSMAGRPKTPKGVMDLADLRRLLLSFPEFKTTEGPVAELLRAAGASEPVFAAWKDLVAQDIEPEDEDSGF